MKILVVEDERDLNNVIVKHLKKENFSADAAFDGEEALEFLAVGEYDLVILDIMMPRTDGFQVLRRIRGDGGRTPVLMLTAKDSVEDRVAGLDLGADDYLVKPFDFQELLARVRAVIRRNHGNSSSLLQAGDLILDLTARTVTRGGVPIDLTAKEYEILEYLMQNKGRVISREQIREHVWDFSYEGESNIVDVLIKNIRKKIQTGDSAPVIHTKRGLGYVVQ